MNGFLNSESGRYTFVSANGSCVVDYCIVSRGLLPSFLSYHGIDGFATRLELMVQSKGICRRRPTQNIHVSSVWNRNCTDVYVNNLCTSLCESGMWDYTEQSNFNVNFATETLTCCMINAADFLEKVVVSRQGQRNP